MSQIHDPLASLDGRSFALLLWGKDEHAQDDVAIFAGVLRNESGALTMLRPDGSQVAILPEWHERIKVPGSGIASIVRGAEYILSLSIGDLPESANTAALELLGLTWPAPTDN